MGDSSTSSGELIKMEDISNIENSLALTRISDLPGPLLSFAQREERLIADEMGSEVVHIYVGLGKAEFSIHKQLLLSAGPIFHEMFPPTRKASERVTLGKEEPAVFKLFVEFLYTRAVPGVHPSLSREANERRLEEVCQLYAFAQKFRVENGICNRVMDAIQDGFRFLDKIPDVGLVRLVFALTLPTSKLRAFCIAAFLYGLPGRGGAVVKTEALTAFLAANKEALREFILAVKRVELLGQDPRVRDCRGDRACVECRGHPERLMGRIGSWPCRFHVHDTHVKGGGRGLKTEADGEASSSSSVVTAGRGGDPVEGCYLWDIAC